jgi:predicted MPP superfamily phosphohydrolase
VDEDRRTGPRQANVQRRPYNERHLRLEKALSLLYAGGWPARLWGWTPWADQVRVEAHDVPAGRVGRPPLRVAFVSDLHLGPTTPRSVLDRAFELLAEAAPDVLVLGGDYVFLGATRPRIRELLERVDRVPATTKLAVLGNHDFWARPERLEDALEGIGVRVLVNEAMHLRAPHDDVAILGLDDPFTGAHAHPDVEAEVDAALAPVVDVPVKIAVCHSPDGYPAVKGRPICLFMAGHTHGGHVALPGYKPLWIPSRYGRIWPYGFHDVDGMKLFVSRGVGGSLVPFRTWAPPDVAVFTVA